VRAALLPLHRPGDQAFDEVLLEEGDVVVKSSSLHDDTKAKIAVAEIRKRLLDHRRLRDEVVGQGRRPRTEAATSS
jgi:hypothetical protein